MRKKVLHLLRLVATCALATTAFAFAEQDRGSAAAPTDANDTAGQVERPDGEAAAGVAQAEPAIAGSLSVPRPPAVAIDGFAAARSQRAAPALPPGPGSLTSCPGIPPGGFTGVTNPRFYFLSEVGGCRNLVCFLNEVAGTPHSNATLVIDQQCTLRRTLRVPSRMTLAGVGMAGEGQLVFTDLPDNASAVEVEDAVGSGGNSEITIRDLALFGDFAGGDDTVAGLDVSGGNIVRVSNVRVTGFSLGLFGGDAFSVLVEHSNISANDINIAIAEDANHWRVRDSVLSQAGSWSAYVQGPANDHLFDGNRFEGSQAGAVRLESHGAVVANNRFESNGGVGVLVTPSAQGTRIIANYLSSDELVDQAADTFCLATFTLGPQPPCELP